MVLLLRGGMLGLFGVALGAQAGWGQAIVADETLGADRSRVVPSVTDLTRSEIQGGSRQGANLFHSFSSFNVDPGKSVYFANPVGIETILGRVTGTGGSQPSISSIQGTLGVSGNANLLLLNPKGFVFGPGATLDIRGSFLASTGTKFSFDNGTEFSAIAPQGAPLLNISVNPGLQLAQANPVGPIVSQGNLTVEGSLGLAGTSLDLKGTLRSGGDVTLLGTQGVTVQAIDTRNSSGSGAVSITSGGDIGLNTYGLIRTNGQNNGAAGDVNLVAGGEVTLGERSVIQSRGYGTGAGGYIRVSANALTLNNRTQLDASNFGSGIGGDIGVDVRNDVTLRGTNTRIVNVVESAAGGRSGNIQVRSGALTIGNGAGIFNGVRGQGTGGNIEVDVRGQVAIDGTGGGSNSAIMNSLYANSSGTSGDIVLRAGSLSLTDGGLITTESDKGASGTAGNINAVIQGNAFMSGIPVDKTLPDISNPPSSSGGKFDVFFLADNTGSMFNVIRSVQTNSGRILSDISGDDTRFAGYDIGYGVGSYVGDPLGEMGLFGEKIPANIAYRLQQPITNSKALTQSALNQWEANNGGYLFPSCQFLLCPTYPNPDIPETNFFALQQVATSGQTALSGVGTGFNTGWRDGANRLIVWFGDAPSFENTVKQSEAIDALKANNVRVIAINTLGAGNGIDQDGQASAIVAATGGILRNSINVLGVTDLLLNAIDSTVFSDYSAIGTNSCSPACTNASGITVGALGNGLDLVSRGGGIRLQAQRIKIEKLATIQSQISGAGNAGDIEVTAPDIELANGASIAGLGIGLNANTGNVVVNSSDRLTIQATSSIISTVIGTGTSGNVTINAGQLSLNAAALGTSSFGSTQAGKLNITANDVRLDDFSVVSTTSAGASRAGDLTLDAKTLALNGGSSIGTVSGTAQSFSDITLDFVDQLLLTTDPSLTAIIAGGLQAIAQLTTLVSQDVLQGNSGRIAINVDRSTTLNYGGIATKVIGSSNGGNLSLTTGNLILTNDSRINSQGDGTGNAGNIGITARDRIFSSNSEIAATASQSDGGNISLDAQEILFRDNSLLSTSVFSSIGGGGNITINARSFVATENSDILANAEDGTGGNISINSPAFLANLFSSGSATPVGRNPGSFDRFRTNARVDISADSAKGTSGIVDVPNIDPGRGLVQLPLGLADRRQIDNPCSQGSSQQTRGLATRDEFVITGRGGIAKTPEDSRSVDALITPWVTLSNATSTLPTPSRSAQSTQSLTEATAVQQLADGRVFLVDPQSIALQLKRSCELNPIDDIKPQSQPEISLNTID
jgi:filamentous hemagglutinin family protein